MPTNALRPPCTTARLLTAVATVLTTLLQIAAATADEQAATKPAPPPSPAEQRLAERRRFQSLQFTTADPATWVFNVGQTPSVVWRSPAAAKELGAPAELRLRWFDGRLREAAAPDATGRWGAWIEGQNPNGTPLRRSLTFCARPKGFFMFFGHGLRVPLPHVPGAGTAEKWNEHRDEIAAQAAAVLFKGLNDSQEGAVLLAGLDETATLGRPADALHSLALRDAEFHLSLKLKLQGTAGKFRPLSPPRKRATPATVLRDGPAPAGVRPDAKARIDDVCQAWVKDSQEPFVVLVAKHGVIVTHAAFGSSNGQPIDLDYRCEVASITKSVTGMVLGLFVDQGLIDLDDPVSIAFPDYPQKSPRVPTFRRCLNHTSGLTGHGEFDGARHPHFENVILAGIDLNQPGEKYVYSGAGFDLAAKAMEVVAGKTLARLYHEHLFRPLGFGDVPLERADYGAKFTARELGVLAQWIANRGSYGGYEFVSPAAFEELLPRPLAVKDRGYIADEGMGIHWIRHVRPDGNAKQKGEQLYSPQTLGHGALTGCIFMIDMENGVVVTQVRAQSGPRNHVWSPRFFTAVAEALGTCGPPVPGPR